MPPAATGRRSRSSGTTARSCWTSRRTISTPRFIADLGELTVEPDTPARVVIDERTGTVVIGREVQISTVAVTHGNLTVRVTEAPDRLAAGAVLRRRDDRCPAHLRRRLADRRPARHRRRRRPADARRRPEPDRAEADRDHRHPAGDQVGRRAAGRADHPVAGAAALSPAQGCAVHGPGETGGEDGSIHAPCDLRPTIAPAGSSRRGAFLRRRAFAGARKKRRASSDAENFCANIGDVASDARLRLASAHAERTEGRDRRRRRRRLTPSAPSLRNG